MNPSLPAESAEVPPAVPIVSYLDAIRAGANDPQRLEDLYQAAHRTRGASQFARDMAVCYEQAPENMLYAAWYYRLRAASDEHVGRLNANWWLAAPLSVTLGLAFWLLSDPRWTLAGHIPLLAVLWMALTALALIWFLVVTARRHYAWAVGAGDLAHGTRLRYSRRAGSS